MNLFTKQKQIHRLCLPRQKGVGGGIYWEFGVSTYKLLYQGWTNNKGLLCSTENYIQHPVINHNGKKYEKVYIYIYIHTHIYNGITNHFAVKQKLISHYKAPILK